MRDLEEEWSPFVVWRPAKCGAKRTSNRVRATPRRRDEAMTRDEVLAERDAIKAQLTVATEEWIAWQKRAMAAEARLVKLDAEAKEAIARVETLTAEVKHREWVENGAKMKGEGP